MSDEQQSTIELSLLQRRFGEAQEELRHFQSAGGGNGTYIPDMSERLGKLEGEVGGLKHAQNMTLGGLALVVALLVGFAVYGLQRIDQLGDRINALNDKVNELPGKISSDLRDLTKTLADVIIATKAGSQSTPAPSPAPTPSPTPPRQK